MRKKFDVNNNWIAFILAALLLNLLIAAAFFTSTPERSPASTWITWGYEARFKLSPLTDKKQLSALHLDSAKISKPECVSCHGTMLDSSVSLHRIHLTSELLPGLVCHDCHTRIDLTRTLTNPVNTKTVRWVDEGYCKKCHSAFPGLQPNSPMRPENFKEDCTTCHSGQHTFRHEQSYLSQVISTKECPGCHGGRVLPWTPLHEQSDWLQLHGPEALRVGKDSCFKCHDFGLKFCDSCHKIKPPSHAPRDNWLIVHPNQARADTRTCFTCHQADFCKKCHVNHQPNWLTDHPKYVAANGNTTCTGCHSLTFCSYCHAAVSQGGQPTTATPSP